MGAILVSRRRWEVKATLFVKLSTALLTKSKPGQNLHAQRGGPLLLNSADGDLEHTRSVGSLLNNKRDTGSGSKGAQG